MEYKEEIIDIHSNSEVAAQITNMEHQIMKEHLNDM